jgi:hypothetical protein
LSKAAPNGAALFLRDEFRNTSGILTVTSAANGDQFTTYAKILDALLALETNNVHPNAVVMSPREARKINGFADTTGQPLQKPDALKDLQYITTPKVTAVFCAIAPGW